MTVRIRKLTAADQPALDAAKLPFSAELLLVGADRNLSACLAVDDNGAIVGLAHASALATSEGSDPTTAIIDQLTIDPAYNDYGPRLTARLAATAHTRGFSQVFARVSVDAAAAWHESGWQVAKPRYAFGWTEADGSTGLIRTLTADDIRDDGKMLALRVSDSTDLYTWAFAYGHQTPGNRAEHALRGFQELVNHPLSDIRSAIDINEYRVI